MTDTEVTEYEPVMARELTAEERRERVQLCASIDNRIKGALADGRKALWALAQALYEFNEENGWTALGFETQEEWLAQPEIGMSRSRFFRLVGVWRELAVYRRVKVPTLGQLDPAKVEIVLPTIKADAAVLGPVLDDVKASGAKELREKYVRQSPPAAEPPNDPEHKRPAKVPALGHEASEARPTLAAGDEPEESDLLAEAFAELERYFADHGGARASRAWRTLVRVLHLGDHSQPKEKS
jgi:hypothetical protein